jgi:hypothetical protein
MPNLFNGYCYSTIDEAALAEISLPAFSSGQGVSVPVAYSVTGSESVDLTYRFKPFSADAQSDYILTRAYPTCSNVGYLTNYTGLDLTDAIATSWMVVLCWAIAYGWKNSRRGL